MHTTNLRKVGGSVMLAVPPAFLEQLALKPGATVGLVVTEGRLIVDPAPRPRYSLEELLAASDYQAETNIEDRLWAQSPPIGKEIL